MFMWHHKCTAGWTVHYQLSTISKCLQYYWYVIWKWHRRHL